MRHALPWEQEGGGPNGHTQEKSLSRPHSLSPSTQDWGEEGREEERERTTEKKKTHTHTHTRAHERAGHTGVAGQ